MMLAVAAAGAVYVGGAGGDALADPPKVSGVKLEQPKGTRVAVVEYQTDAPGIATFQFKTNGVDVSHSEIVRTVTGDISKYLPSAGTYTFTWDAGRDFPENIVSNLSVVVTLWATNNPPTYCAVKLVAEPNGQYPVYWYGKASEVPFGVNDSWWKNDWLLLRQIPSTQGQSVTLGSPGGEPGRSTDGRENLRNVRITRPFYMGVFPVTQRQWENVYGNKPSNFNNPGFYEERPVEQVSWNTVRGNGAAGAAYDWPDKGHAVDPNSFMGRLRSRTGNILTFDLPTETQWQYACRAGTAGAWNNGTTTATPADVPDANLDLLGRYKWNGGQIYNSSMSRWDDPPQDCTDENATAKVGSYLPNAWGLYDMHGNVTEWCLDWYAANGTDPSLAGDDPAGLVNGSDRSLCGGGGWNSAFGSARSARRTFAGPSTSSHSRGFRVSARAEALIAP